MVARDRAGKTLQLDDQLVGRQTAAVAGHDLTALLRRRRPAAEPRRPRARLGPRAAAGATVATAEHKAGNESQTGKDAREHAPAITGKPKAFNGRRTPPRPMPEQPLQELTGRDPLN